MVRMVVGELATVHVLHRNGSTRIQRHEAIAAALGGPHESSFYVPRARLFFEASLIAEGADNVARVVKELFASASAVDVDIDTEVVIVTARLGTETIRADFHVRFGLIGTVNLWARTL
jgi:hypothetical protein